MASHSSVLAWRIPWTEEPGGATVRRVAKSPTGLSILGSGSVKDTVKRKTQFLSSRIILWPVLMIIIIAMSAVTAALYDLGNLQPSP